MSRSDTEFLLHIKDELNFLETNSKNIDFSKQKWCLFFNID
jgi:hypothetical protein